MTVVEIVPHVLRRLDDGRIIRRVVSMALKVQGVLLFLWMAVLLIPVLKLAFQLDTAATIGGILLGLTLLLFGIAGLQIHFHRADGIAALPDSPFTVIPIVSVVLRLVGEVYALGLVLLGLGSALFMLLAQASPAGVLGPAAVFLPEDMRQLGALAGPLMLVVALVAAFAVLLVFYFLAESVLVMADVARNIRLLVARTTAPQPPPVHHAG